MDNDSRNLYGLHGLRAVAAFLVIAFHFELIIHQVELSNPDYDKSQFIYRFFSRTGPIGVEIFFLISGFIMIHTTYTLQNKEWWKFLVRRFFRIFPAYWCCLAIYWQLITPETSVTKFIEAMFLIPNNHQEPPTFGLSLLIVAWTLTYEIIFYIYIAVFVFLIPPNWRGRSYPVLILGITLVIQYSLSGSITVSPQNAPVASYDSYLTRIIGVMANPLFFLFALGAFFGNLYKLPAPGNNPIRWGRMANAISIFALLIAVPAYWLLPEAHGFYGVSVAAILVFISVVVQDHANLAGRSLIIKKLGDWSYGMYLIHEILFEYVAIRNPSFWARHDSPIDFLLVSLLIIGISSILYQTIEKPAMNIGHSLCNTSRQPTILMERSPYA